MVNKAQRIFIVRCVKNALFYTADFLPLRMRFLKKPPDMVVLSNLKNVYGGDDFF